MPNFTFLGLPCVLLFEKWPKLGSWPKQGSHMVLNIGSFWILINIIRDVPCQISNCWVYPWTSFPRCGHVLSVLILGCEDMDVLCTYKFNIKSQNLEHGQTKDQWPCPNQELDAKPQSGTSSILQSPKSGLKGYGCSLHLQNQDREPKFGSWVYQRPVTISK